MPPSTAHSSSAMQGIKSLLQSGRLVTVPADIFLENVLGYDLDEDYLNDLSSNIPVSYEDIRDSLASSGPDFKTASLALLRDLNGYYERNRDVIAHDSIQYVDISKTGIFKHPVEPTSSATPDIVALNKRIVESWTAARKKCGSPHTSLAWHHISAGVLVHSEKIQPQRSVEFVWTLLQGRPDLAGSVALSISHDSFQLFWADASAVYQSAPVPWDERTLRFLLAFVHRVHNPLLDPSITLDRSAFNPKPKIRNATPIHARRPLWLVESHGEVYLVDEVMAVGDPMAGWKWIASATKRRLSESSKFETIPRIVIKDFWPMASKEGMTEDVILGHVHAEGKMPGVCNLIASSCVSTEDGELMTLRITNAKRLRKHRMVLDGTSSDINKCDSILDFLIVLYDCLETLKHLHERRGVLYRDVSLGNVRRRSRLDNTDGATVKGTFLGDILADSYSNPRIRRGPACEIIDFDHSFSKTHMDVRRLRYGVGTLPFIARAVVQTFDITDSSPMPSFPQLHGEARHCYVLAHGLDRYKTCMGSHPTPTIAPRAIPPDHRHSSPRHDAESCFWLITYFLATALPEGVNVDDDTTVAHHVCLAMDATEFDAPDARASFFEAPEIWTQCLHPSLQRFGKLIQDLAEQVRPIYDAWGEAHDEYHLHNAMQMILLQEICRILDEGADVSLNAGSRCRVGGEGPSLEADVIPGEKRRGESLTLPEARRMRIAGPEL